MNAQPGFCALCGGEMEPGTTTFTVDFATGVVVVRDVPALACRLCGGASIEDRIAMRLETVVDDARRRQATVEVTNWRRGPA